MHGIFQKLSRFEVNNADTIRSVIRAVRVVTIIGLVLGIVGIVVGVAVPLSTAALAIGRREDLGEEKADLIDWNYVDQVSQSVIYAIENGKLKYEMWHGFPLAKKNLVVWLLTVKCSGCQVPHLSTTILLQEDEVNRFY